MRNAYTEQMDQLSAGMSEMCYLASDLMEKATDALLHANLTAAEETLSAKPKLDQLAEDNINAGYTLLALQTPVATDLRQVVSCIQLVQDVRRMGALAFHVAKMARRRHPNHVLPESVTGYFSEMGRLAVRLGRTAAEILVSRDPIRASSLSEEDDAMDDLHQHLFTVLTVREWDHGVAAAVDVSLLGRFYERFGDHAVEVSHKVIFLATGKPHTEFNPDDEVFSMITEELANSRLQEAERRLSGQDKTE